MPIYNNAKSMLNKFKSMKIITIILKYNELPRSMQNVYLSITLII